MKGTRLEGMATYSIFSLRTKRTESRARLMRQQSNDYHS